MVLRNTAINRTINPSLVLWLWNVVEVCVSKANWKDCSGLVYLLVLSNISLMKCSHKYANWYMNTEYCHNFTNYENLLVASMRNWTRFLLIEPFQTKVLLKIYTCSFISVLLVVGSWMWNWWKGNFFLVRKLCCPIMAKKMVYMPSCLLIRLWFYFTFLFYHIFYCRSV